MFSQLHNIWRSRRRKFMLHRHKSKMCSLYITMKLRILGKSFQDENFKLKNVKLQIGKMGNTAKFCYKLSLRFLDYLLTVFFLRIPREYH